jgi:hypothetical protein
MHIRHKNPLAQMAGEVFLVTRFRKAAFREGAPIIIATGMKAHPVNISAPLTLNRHRGFDLLRVIAACSTLFD